MNRRLFLATCIGVISLLHDKALKSQTVIAKYVFRLPDIKNLYEAPDFSTFYTLSQILTYQDDLKHGYAEKIYKVFLEEPWSAKHINTVVTVIKEYSSHNNRAFDIHDAMSVGLFEENETWFISHLIYTWFTGIYYFTGKDQRIAYHDALINTVLDGLYVIPTYSDQAPGFWSELPESLV